MTETQGRCALRSPPEAAGWKGITISAAIEDSEIHRRVCPLCEGMCGVQLTVSGGRVHSVRPDPENVWSRGHMCPKGTTLGSLHHDPDRLRAPMLRRGGEWREAGWEEAFTHLEHLVAQTREARPDGASACYLGNMLGKGFSASRYPFAFLNLARMDQFYSSGTVDTYPRVLTNQLLYGGMMKTPVPDVDRCELLVVMGGNPAASKGSFFAHRDHMAAFRDLRARGGRLIVIDPVKTGTAEKADQWIPIRPGGDAAMLLAVAHVIFAENAVRLRNVAGLVAGLEKIATLVARFPPERVAAFCGVPAEVIRGLARDLLAVDRAAIYGRIGLCNQEFGTLATWMVDVLAIITGNMDRIGGSLWSTQIAAHHELFPGYPQDLPVVGRHSRVRGAPEVLGQFPAACLAEEMATPGPGQITLFVTLGANPVLSIPNSAQLDNALANLGCMVSFDNYINETTRHAHVILPGLSLLEQPHWDVFGWPYALSSAGHYSEPLFDPGDRPAEWRVLLRLAGILGGNPRIDVDAADDAYFGAMCDQRGIDRATAFAASPERGPGRILELAIRGGAFGDHYGKRPGLTLQDFKDHPAGIFKGHAAPQGAAALRTASGKIELGAEYILNDVPRLEAAMARPAPATMLVSRRHLRSLNSWMHNVESLVRGKDRCTLQLHPADAARIAVANGEKVKVTSASGEVTVPAELTESIPPGLVSLPHGWGHDAKGARLRIANLYQGVNTNILTPGTMDAPSGNAVFNGIPVTIARADADG